MLSVQKLYFARNKRTIHTNYCYLYHNMVSVQKMLTSKWNISVITVDNSTQDIGINIIELKHKIMNTRQLNIVEVGLSMELRELRFCVK